MRASAFLQLLWGERPAGLIQLWQLKGRRATYLQSPQLGDYYADGRVDVYTGVGLAGSDLGRARRARSSEVVAIAGLWLDVDVKPGAAPHVGAAAALASALLAPTLLVRSGHGLHAWWLFESPWRFASHAEQAAGARASLQWQTLHRDLARAHGQSLDATHDLARLLRPPGTLNGKQSPAAPVAVVGQGPRYPRAELLARAARAGDVEGSLRLGAAARPRTGTGGPPPGAPTRAGAPTHTGAPTSAAAPTPDAGARAHAAHPTDLQLAPDPTPPFDLLRALIDADRRFAATWRHQRDDTGAGAWSLSEYDLSLAVQLAAAGLDDQAIAETLRFHRRRWRADDRKGDRIDYLRRTIAKARATVPRAAAPAPQATQASRPHSGAAPATPTPAPASATPAPAPASATPAPAPAARADPPR